MLIRAPTDGVSGWGDLTRERGVFMIKIWNFIINIITFVSNFFKKPAVGGTNPNVDPANPYSNFVSWLPNNEGFSVHFDGQPVKTTVPVGMVMEFLGNWEADYYQSWVRTQIDITCRSITDDNGKPVYGNEAYLICLVDPTTTGGTYYDGPGTCNGFWRLPEKTIRYNDEFQVLINCVENGTDGITGYQFFFTPRVWTTNGELLQGTKNNIIYVKGGYLNSN